MNTTLIFLAGMVMGGVCGCILSFMLVAFLFGIADKDYSGIDDYNNDNY